MQTWVELVLNFEPEENLGQGTAPVEVVALPDSNASVQPASIPYGSPYADPYGTRPIQAEAVAVPDDQTSTETKALDGPGGVTLPDTAPTKEKDEARLDRPVPEPVTEEEAPLNSPAVEAVTEEETGE